MIAKRITSKAATSRIARLVRYVVAAEGGIDPRSWTRTADYMLASGTSSRGEKVGGVRVTNCNTDDPAAATTLIEATQAVNTRSRTDKTYHLVFSFPPGEEPPLEVLHKIEDELVAAIGFSDHQRISAVHIDTDHLHVHVAINKVHPKGFQNIEPYFDKKKLMEACERLEIEHGLQRTNHGLTGQQTKKEKEQARLKDKVAQAEAHSGIETLVGYVTREVAPAMREAKDWPQLHATLAKHGLQIKQRGAGLVIGNGATWVKASQCDRSFSMKALTDKLGAFDPGSVEVKEPYQPKPKQKHPASAALYARYQHEREVTQHARKQALDRLHYDKQVMEFQMKKWKTAQRLLVKVAAKGPKRRAMLKTVTAQTAITRAANCRAANKKRTEIIDGTRMVPWWDWIAQQAEAGNPDAAKMIRHRQEMQDKLREIMRGNCLTVQNPDATPWTVIPHPTLKVSSTGLMTYRTNDGGFVVDRIRHIQALTTTAESTLLALELAAKRYAGQTLIVEGQDAFKADIARLAAERGIKVVFAKTRSKSTDKGMEI